MNWHQEKAKQRAYKTRNIPAHIKGLDYVLSGKCLCGATDPRVWIERNEVKPENEPICKTCLKVKEKQDNEAAIRREKKNG